METILDFIKDNHTQIDRFLLAWLIIGSFFKSIRLDKLDKELDRIKKHIGLDDEDK